MPAVTWTGDQALDALVQAVRAYAFTDRDCVNVVSRARSSGAPRSRHASTARPAPKGDSMRLASVLPNFQNGTRRPSRPTRPGPNEAFDGRTLLG
jgi:hypothetical protein